MADDANLVLSKYGEYLYKNLIVFAPTVLEFGGQIDTEAITKFIDDGGNLLMAGNAAAGDVYREIASECGFEVIFLLLQNYTACLLPLSTLFFKLDLDII